MDATIRILGTAGLVASVLLSSGAARGQESSCLFTLNIPALHVFPLMRHGKGDDDMEGHRPRIDLEALIHQPESKKGRRAKNLRLDLSVRIADFAAADGCPLKAAHDDPFEWVAVFARRSVALRGSASSRGCLMPLDNAEFISELDIDSPAGTDPTSG